MGQVQMTNTCLVPVSGVERPHKGTGKGEARREGQTAGWRRDCGTRVALESPKFILPMHYVIVSAGSATFCLFTKS